MHPTQLLLRLYNLCGLYFKKEVHEHIRRLSQEAGAVVKEQGGENDLVERIRMSSFFAPVHNQLERLLDPSTFIGRAPQQVSYMLCNSNKKTRVSGLQEATNTSVGEN